MEETNEYILNCVAKNGEPWNPPTLEPRSSLKQIRDYFYLLRCDGSVWGVTLKEKFKYADPMSFVHTLLGYNEGSPLNVEKCDKLQTVLGVYVQSPSIINPIVVTSTVEANRRAAQFLKDHSSANTLPRGDCVLCFLDEDNETVFE